MTITDESVWWRRRGRACTIDLHEVASVAARTVVINEYQNRYVLLGFSMHNGAEILSRALFGKVGTSNATMVEDAVGAITARLDRLQRFGLPPQTWRSYEAKALINARIGRAHRASGWSQPDKPGGGG